VTGVAATHEHALSSDQIAQYGRDGYLLVRGLLPLSVAQSLRRPFEAAVDRFAQAWKADGFVDDTFDDEDFLHRWVRLRSQVPARISASWRAILVSPEVHELWQEPHLIGAMRSLIGDELYAHGIWNGRPRDPGTPQAQQIMWHQDAAYYPEWDPADGPLVTCWTPLIPVDETNGCLQVVPGSHTRGYVPFELAENGIRAFPRSALEGTDRAFSAVMQPGDVLLFNATMLHQSLENHSDHTRWSIDVRFGPANDSIISKAGPGYRCFSATDPSVVESFDTWAGRYVREQAEEEAAARAAWARERGMSTLELDAF
jgi:hypothetical protein